MFCEKHSTKLECDFVNLFSRCLNQTYRPKANEIKIDDISFTLRWLQYIMLIILHPIFALIAIINNALVIFIIKNKSKKKLFKDRMYSHAIINAILNIAFCILIPFSLMTRCIYSDTNAFCSSLFTLIPIQYFKIIVVNFLGSAMSTCTNLTYTFFLLSQFILATNFKEKLLLKKFSQINLKLYVSFVILFGVLLSLHNLFQYKINWDMTSELEFPYEIYDEFLCTHELNGYTFNQYKVKCRLFDALKMIYEIFNDIIIFLANLLIDLLLLFQFNKEMKQKMSMRSSNDDNSDLLHKKKNMNRMVLIRSIVFVLSHVSQFVTTVVVIVKKKSLGLLCFYGFSWFVCNLIGELAHFFGILTMMLQFYIFLFFNRNFRESFDDRWKCLKERLLKK